MTARVLIIAGSDSGGGAGIQADIKAVTMLGGHAMTAITAITAQNTLGVQGVHAIPAEMVLAQIDSVASDIGVDAMKIGMIGSAETAAAVAGRVTRPRLARGAGGFGPGVDAENETVIDRLFETGEGEVARWEAPRIDTPHTHGTGCTLASAIATGLAQGMPLEPAIARARDFVRLSLLDAPGLGSGHGPMGQQAVRNDGLFTGPALNQITLPANDYSASVAFYKQLGLTQIIDSPDNGYARFEAANGVTLSIHTFPSRLREGLGEGMSSAIISSETSPPPTPPASGRGERGTTVYLESGALDAWVAYLARRGVSFEQMPKDEEWGWREARLTDPAGNRLCLYQAGEYRRYPPWRI